MNKLLSPRELTIARNVAWAEKEGLHAEAISFAREYDNLDRQMLRLISDYFNAGDLTDGVYQKTAVKEALFAIVRYVATFSRE